MQPSVVMTTQLEHPTLWGRHGRSPIRDGWWWTARVSERGVVASRVPPEVSSCANIFITRKNRCHLIQISVRSLQWPGYFEVLPYWGYLDQSRLPGPPAPVPVHRQRPRGVEVWATRFPLHHWPGWGMIISLFLHPAVCPAARMWTRDTCHELGEIRGVEVRKTVLEMDSKKWESRNEHWETSGKPEIVWWSKLNAKIWLIWLCCWTDNC